MHHIALDWGSSRLRAYALKKVSERPFGADIVEERSADVGVFSIQNNNFESALRTLIGDWLDAHPTIGISAAGMIGSVNGWREAPYVATPARMEDLRTRCVTVSFEHSAHVLRIVPGVRQGAGCETDVMRGEETQIFGVLGSQPDGVFCLPGTHCKWVVVRDRRIVDFRTHYSGEIYQWLATHSSVGKVLDVAAPFDEVAFDAGAARAADAPADLLHQLFTLRASVVARERTGAFNASALQGIIIGNDVFSGVSYLRRRFETVENVSIIGATGLSALYARALAAQGLSSALHAADATVKGLAQIFGDVAST